MKTKEKILNAIADARTLYIFFGIWCTWFVWSEANKKNITGSVLFDFLFYIFYFLLLIALLFVIFYIVRNNLPTSGSATSVYWKRYAVYVATASAIYLATWELVHLGVQQIWGGKALCNAHFLHPDYWSCLQ